MLYNPLPEDIMTTKEIIKNDSLTETEKKLVETARAYSERAYCPYSKFPVGAGLLAENPKGDRKVFGGFNVENASYGGSVCAERTAVFSALLEGYNKVLTIAVYCPRSLGSSPCGFCRQVIREFGKDAEIIITYDTAGNVTKWSQEELLPNSFGPESL